MGYRVYCKNGNVKLIKWVLVIQNAYIYIYIYIFIEEADENALITHHAIQKLK